MTVLVERIHVCSSTVDNQADAWMAVPKGLCERLTGGSLEQKIIDRTRSCNKRYRNMVYLLKINLLKIIISV